MAPAPRPAPNPAPAPAPAPAVTLHLDGPVARVTLNRPQRLNAIDLAWIDDLNRVVDTLARRTDLAVAIVRGAGRAFCAGLDLDMLAAAGMPPGFYAGQERAFRQLEVLDVITVAAIHGYCLGGGVQLAIACDLRVCSADATFGLPAVGEGLFPGLAPFRLPRLVGRGTAARLILSGERLAADEALRVGLVDYVEPAEDFEARLARLVEPLLAAPRAAVKGSKRLMREAFDGTWQTAYDLSLPLLEACLASADVAAARQARRARTGGLTRRLRRRAT